MTTNQYFFIIGSPPNGSVVAARGSLALDIVNGIAWLKASTGIGNTGWVAVGQLNNIFDGYGTLPLLPNNLSIGAGGAFPDSVSFAFGDGSGYKLNLITNVSGSPTVFATFKDTGQFSTGWVGAGIGSPSSGSSTFDATEAEIGLLGIGGLPDHSGGILLKVYGDTEVVGNLNIQALSLGRPVLTDASHNLVSGKVDLSSSIHIQASGLSAGQIIQWGGLNVTGTTGLASGTVSEIPGGAPTPVSVLTSASLGGVVPPGLTLSTTSSSVSDTFSVNSHAVFEGIVIT